MRDRTTSYDAVTNSYDAFTITLTVHSQSHLRCIHNHLRCIHNHLLRIHNHTYDAFTTIYDAFTSNLRCIHNHLRSLTSTYKQHQPTAAHGSGSVSSYRPCQRYRCHGLGDGSSYAKRSIASFHLVHNSCIHIKSSLITSPIRHLRIPSPVNPAHRLISKPRLLLPRRPRPTSTVWTLRRRMESICIVEIVSSAAAFAPIAVAACPSVVWAWRRTSRIFVGRVQIVSGTVVAAWPGAWRWT
jgi:hypothetical protein